MKTYSLNPLKRVNSILTVEDLSLDSEVALAGLNPLKRVNSILTILGDFVNIDTPKCLNPLKRVNSILTPIFNLRRLKCCVLSQSPQTGQFNSYRL